MGQGKVDVGRDYFRVIVKRVGSGRVCMVQFGKVRMSIFFIG